MEKLSEAGRLYLKDYTILEEARKDMIRYLNAVVEEANELINEEIEELAPEGFRVSTKKVKASKGKLFIRFECLEDYKGFRKNKVDISVSYRDIRRTSDLSDSTFTKIYSNTPKIASDLESKMRSLSEEKFGVDIYKPEYVNLNLDNSSKSAEEIKENILDKCNKIRKLINELIEKENLRN